MLHWAMPWLTAALVQCSSTDPSRARRRLSSPLLLSQDPVAEITAEQAAVDASDVCDALRSLGVARVNGVLSPRTAEALLSHVDDALEEALLGARDTFTLESGDTFAQHFGKVLARQSSSGTTIRHDLKLDLQPPVSSAVEELLAALGPSLADCLGTDAVLYELAALVSDPGSPQQPYHPDTSFCEDQGIAVLTAFVALQPIDASMGPTNFVPSSHTAAAHAAFNTRDDGSRAFHALLRSRPIYRGLLGQGDATRLARAALRGCQRVAAQTRAVLCVIPRTRREGASWHAALRSAREALSA